MSRKVIFQDFLVPMKIYNVIRRPDISNLGPQDLVLDRNDQISVPLALSMVLPLSETSEFRIPASKIGHRTSSDAIKNDNVGLVVFSSKILELATTQPRRGETAEAHAVALNDGSDPQDGFLKYSRGDPLWILKKPVKQRKKTVRSKESISPFAVIMANLRTGDAGYMLTTEVHLFPHRKRRTDTIAEGLLHKIGYTKFNDDKNNQVHDDDIFTTPHPPRQHWDPSTTEMILFVINNRTRHYGYLPFNCVRDLSQDEFHAWVKENLGPPSSCRISSRGLNKSDLVADSSRSIEHSNTNADTPKFDYTPPENAKWHIEPETSTTMKCLPDEGGWVWDDEVSELVENQRRKIGGSEWIAKRIRPGGQ